MSVQMTDRKQLQEPVMTVSNLSISSTAFVLAILASPYALAQGDDTSDWQFDTSVTLTSDYVFRGVSQTMEDPALQGEFTVSHGSGFYLGAWASNIDFGDDADIELDLYAGYSNAIGEAGYYNIALLYYGYPGADADYDYFELMGEVGTDLGGGTVKAGFYYSPDNFLESGEAFYPYIGGEVDLGQAYEIGFSLDAEIGHQLIDDEATFGISDYTTWQIGLGISLQNVTLDLRYHDTDIDGADMIGADERFVASLSASF
jgi:uncharacterized protein (TIGR02001 family)